jgi:aminoglycoside 3-N-acetyltransferase
MITAHDFRKLLQKVILPTDDVVLVYSGIWTFGHRFKELPKRVPEIILDCIEDAVGNQRTLLLPTYTYRYNKVRQYDIRTSKPETGILPELFLKRSGVRRTRSAISSFAVQGPLADTLVPILGESIWGKGSLLEWMENANIRIISLGLPWAHSCGYLHRIEEIAAVPYRYYKDFPGEYCDENGNSKKWTETMYVRPLNITSTFNWALVNDLMDQREQILKGSVPGITIESCLAKDMIAAGLDLVLKDPYALVRNAIEVRNWVENGGKEKECAEMKMESK